MRKIIVLCALVGVLLLFFSEIAGAQTRASPSPMPIMVTTTSMPRIVVVAATSSGPLASNAFWDENSKAIVAALIVLISGIILSRLLRPNTLAKCLGRLGSGWGFQKRYLIHLTEEYRGLNIRGRKTRPPVAVELEQVYVSLYAQVPDVALGPGEPPILSIGQAMARHERLAILGGPGMGKTTLLAYLTLTYARGQASERLGLTEKRLPILVPLRQLKQVLEGGGGTLPAYLTQRYTGLGMRPRENFFERALRDGRCLVLLDGLDEVADAAERRRMSEWVDGLVALYPHNRYVVTSRPPGYESAPLENGFTVLRICDFSAEEIRQFATNWCLAVELTAQGEDNPTARRRAREVARDLVAVIEEGAAIRRLAVNPLLLSIIALVHRHRGALPKRRVDVYAECVDVLLGYWDEAKGLADRLSLHQKRAILQPLALGMHRERRSEISRRELEEHIGALLSRVGGQAAEASDFLDEVRERSGLLVEAGLGQYAFSSRGFQEYLCARQIAQDESALGLLLERAGDEWWQEVTLFYVGMADATPVIRALLVTRDEADSSQLLLAGRCVVEAVRVESAVRDEVLRKLEDAFVYSTGRQFLETGQVLADIVGEDDVDFFLHMAHDDPNRREAALWSLEQISQQPNESLRERVLTRLSGHLQVQGLYREAFTVLAGVWGIDMIAAELCSRLSPAAFRQAAFVVAEMMDSMTVTISDGEFLRGDTKQKGFSDAFRIDRCPVTNAQYKRFLEATGHYPPKHWKSSDYPPEKALHPVVNVSWDDATAYAEWADKRLPTEEEWKKAARGIDGRVYPWGDLEPTPEHCNFGNNEGSTTPVGHYSPQGDSPYGCADMAGNVWEWCSSLAESYSYLAAYDREDLEGKEGRVIRGGSWATDGLAIRCSSHSLIHPNSIRDDIGFRLVSRVWRLDRETAGIIESVETFFSQAGFVLQPVPETLAYRGEPPSSFRRILPSVVHLSILMGEELNAEHVRAIHRKMKGIDAEVKIVLAITDRRPTGEGWAQIGTLRMEGFTLLPIESTLLNEGRATGRERALLRKEIEERLGADYDPYDVRDPVAGAFSFFGRDALVEDLLRRVVEGRPVGVFGLRKMGKSSLLQALCGHAPFPVASVNLQTVGHAALDELYTRILRYWGQWMRGKMGIEVNLPTIAPNDPSGSFVAATLALLEQLDEHQDKPRIGLLLDEVELIVPRPDGSGPDPKRYLMFLRAVRGGLIDEDGRLSLVVASLNPSINRINAWNGEQNPTFSLFQEIYLPPLAQEDCIQMVRNIGQQVGLVYDDESVETVAVLTGGHPFLARQLCSLLYRQRDRQPGQIAVADVPAGVERFIYDEQTVTHLDAGIWQDAGNSALWGEAQAQVNQELLLELARADSPVSQDALLDTPDADLRRTALINLERFHFIHQSEPGHYALRYGLLRTWLRRRKLGLE